MSTTDARPTAVTATAVRTDRPDRWVRLTLAVRDPAAGVAGLTHPARFACAIEPRDELAASYELENWEGGLLSGYFFACRRARRLPPPPPRVTELAGALGSDDMDGVAHAAAAAAAHLFGLDRTQFQTGDWRVTVSPPAPVTAPHG